MSHSPVEESAHRVGRVLHRLADTGLVEVTAAEVQVEIDAVTRAELGDLSERAVQAVALDRLDVSLIQVTTADEMLRADPLGGGLLSAAIDPGVGAGADVGAGEDRGRRRASAELVPGVIWIYDFTHFHASKWCAVAVLDVVSRYWMSTVVSAEESSTQVEVAFTRALLTDGKDHLLEDPALLAELAGGVVPDRDELPVLLAVSDNGPQMTSQATATFLAGARIAQHFGRPGTPNDQAWIESLFGHVKTEFPFSGSGPWCGSRPRGSTRGRGR